MTASSQSSLPMPISLRDFMAKDFPVPPEFQEPGSYERFCRAEIENEEIEDPPTPDEIAKMFCPIRRRGDDWETVDGFLIHPRTNSITWMATGESVSPDFIKRTFPRSAWSVTQHLISDIRRVNMENHPWLKLVEDGADIMREELEPVAEIVAGIVGERSKLVIVSGAKSFKTWLTIYMALCISKGVNFLRRPTVRRRVLYVNLELKAGTFKFRLQKIASALDLEVENGWFNHLPLRGQMAGVSVHELVCRIIKVAQSLDCEVVVIDPVFKANTEGEENSSRDQTIFFNELDRITTEGGCTLILNDHSGKGNQSEKDPLDVIRGSSAKGGDLDAAMVLRKHEVDGCFTVDMVHRELPPVEPFVISWEFPLMVLRDDLDAAKMKKAKGGRTKAYTPEKLLSAIARTTKDSPISISAWAIAANIKRPTLNEYLSGFRSNGWIATAGEGNTARQYITEKGLKMLKGEAE